MARLIAFSNCYLSLPLVTIFIFVVSSFSTNLVAKSNPLPTFQWNKRILILVTPNTGNKKYVKQIEMIKNKLLGIKDRDIIVIKIIDQKLLGVSKEQSREGDVLEILNLYNLNGNKFSILLIGKDGDEKVRSINPLSMCIFFDLIDSMPMRKNEILERGKNVKC